MNKDTQQILSLKNKIVQLEINNKLLKAQIKTLINELYSKEIKVNTEEAFKQS